MPVAGRSLVRKPNRVSDGDLHSARREGLPMPVAGRSLRASCPALARCFLRFVILTRGGNKRRLPGTGSPSLALSASGHRFFVAAGFQPAGASCPKVAAGFQPAATHTSRCARGRDTQNATISCVWIAVPV